MQDVNIYVWWNIFSSIQSKYKYDFIVLYKRLKKI